MRNTPLLILHFTTIVTKQKCHEIDTRAYSAYILMIFWIPRYEMRRISYYRCIKWRINSEFNFSIVILHSFNSF